MFKDMIKDIVTSYGPAGRETTVSKTIRKYIEPLVDEVYYDALGNLIAHKKGTSGKKIMLSAHMDQIGFIVTDIDENGFLRVATVGGVNPHMVLSQGVVFENGVKGLVYMETKDPSYASLDISKLFIDICAASKEEAEKLVEIGDMAVYRPDFVDMGKRISCAAMDDRIGCAVMIEAFKKANTEHDIYLVFTVQEEVGCRGAGVAAYAIEPDFNINFDVTSFGDTPNATFVNISLGKGAAIKVMDSSVIVPTAAREFLESCANEIGAKFQREILRAGGTDTSAVQKSRCGVMASCISIPCRYVHSQVEMVDMDDVNACVDITACALSRKELPGF